MNGKHRTNAGFIVQVLLLVRSGVSVSTNLQFFSGCTWRNFKEIRGFLISGGYISVDDSESKRTTGALRLTEKGRRFCKFVDEFMDVFEKDLNKFFRYS